MEWLQTLDSPAVCFCVCMVCDESSSCLGLEEDLLVSFLARSFLPKTAAPRENIFLSYEIFYNSKTQMNITISSKSTFIHKHLLFEVYLSVIYMLCFFLSLNHKVPILTAADIHINYQTILAPKKKLHIFQTIVCCNLSKAL